MYVQVCVTRFVEPQTGDGTGLAVLFVTAMGPALPRDDEIVPVVAAGSGWGESGIGHVTSNVSLLLSSFINLLTSSGQQSTALTSIRQPLDELRRFRDAWTGGSAVAFPLAERPSGIVHAQISSFSHKGDAGLS